jgi:hypothetical protein
VEMPRYYYGPNRGVLVCHSIDVSEAMARKVLEIAEREDYELTEGTLEFVEAHGPRLAQPTLPLW